MPPPLRRLIFLFINMAQKPRKRFCNRAHSRCIVMNLTRRFINHLDIDFLCCHKVWPKTNLDTSCSWAPFVEIDPFLELLDIIVWFICVSVCDVWSWSQMVTMDPYLTPANAERFLTNRGCWPHIHLVWESITQFEDFGSWEIGFFELKRCFCIEMHSAVGGLCEKHRTAKLHAHCGPQINQPIGFF